MRVSNRGSNQGIGLSTWLLFAVPRSAILLALVLIGATLRVPMMLLYALLAADCAFFTWQVLRFQSDADDHLRGMGAMAPIWGGYLLLLISGFASISLWWGAFLFAGQPVARELFTDQMDRLHAAEYTLTLSSDHTTLRFEGTITFGLTKRARTLMAQTPQLTKVTLNSPGGHIYEARGFAYLIRDHGLDTHATQECSSACTLLFAAGRHRSLATGARLGFHRYALETGVALPNLDLQKEQEKDREFLRDQGISETFLIQIFEKPSTDLWFPSPAQIQRSGLLAR